MAVNHVELLSPAALHKLVPRTDKAEEVVNTARKEVQDVLEGKDDRLVVVVGPCSIHDQKAAIEYAERLKGVRQQLQEDLIVLMRVYFEKPRTTVGWKGLVNDPDLDGSCNISKGLKVARQLLATINELGVPAATEFLDVLSANFISDLVSWGAIGARTTESQGHREMVSGLPIPVGFKNSTAGDVQVAVDAVGAALRGHTYLSVSMDGKATVAQSSGNPHAHIILRGGKGIKNFDQASVDSAAAALSKAGLSEKSIVVDCSHANSDKKFQKQREVAESIAQQLQQGCESIRGVMIESHLVEGNQSLNPGKTDVASLAYGQSVTDACIGWDTTIEVLNLLAQASRQRRLAKSA